MESLPPKLSVGRRTDSRATGGPGTPGLARCGALLAVLMAGVSVAWAAEPAFQEDFSKAEVGQVPGTFLVIDGQFAVQEDGGNRFLELPGSPLETYGVMFGPAAKDGLAAEARFHGTGQGRRFPVFGVSVNGIAGYRLQVAPAKKAIELLKGDTVQASAPFVWESGSWTRLRIQLRKEGDGAWRVEGKAWKDGTEEPKAWGISWNEGETPVAGRSAIWGKPFSGTAIRFDDFRVGPAQAP